MKIYKNSKKIFKISLLLIGIAVIFSFGINTTAAVVTPSIYVSTHGNNSWDGQHATWNGTSGPKATIKNATGTITSGGTVHIAGGTYKENNITINKNMNIIGENPKNTIVYGTSNGSIFKILSGIKVTIFNLTLKGGNASNGGAIYNDGNLTVRNSNFINNKASNCGGAIYNDYTSNKKGVLTLSGSTFTNNNAIYGGAIGAISNFGTLTVTATSFTSNIGKWGGAIYNDDLLNIKNSTFIGNTANSGGAIYNEGNAAVNFNRIFRNNAKSQGSAIFNDLGTVNVSLNWWGSNANPSNNVYGTKISTWLVLTVTANPKIIQKYGHSTITADLRHDNLGKLETGYLLNAIPVTFTTTLGTIINKAVLINGIAQSTLKSGSKAGIATVSAKLDNQIVKTAVTIKDTISPKISLTSPKNGATGFSRTNTIAIKFTEYIKESSNWSKIVVKDKYGHAVRITKSIAGTTLFIKTNKRAANSWYIVSIPASAIKNLVGNNLTSSYTFKFKTGS